MNPVVNPISRLLLMDAGVSESWSPESAIGANLTFLFDPAYKKTILKENGTTGVPITDISIATDPVGILYDKAQGLEAKALSDATRPTFGTDGTRGGYVTFNGTTQRMRVFNTQKYFKAIHASGSNAYCFMLWIKINAANGVDAVVCDNREYTTTANSGFTIVRGSNNKITFVVTYSSGGNFKVIGASTANLTSADGWQPVIFYSEGNGTNKFHVILGNNADVTSNVGAVGSAVDCFGDLRLGCNVNENSFGAVSIGTFFGMNRIPTAEEITNFKLYNKLPNTENWVVHKKKFDFNDSTFGFADTAETTPITNGVAFRSWKSSLASPFGDLNRRVTTGSAGVSAIWRTAQQNGKAALEYDGVDDTGSLSDPFFNGRGGRYTYKVICKNRDTLLGSHFMAGVGGGGYGAVTGTNYPGNAGTNGGLPYGIVHGSVGEVGPVQLPNGGEGVNIFYLRRDGSTVSMWSGDKIKVTVTITDVMFYNAIGPAINVGWDMNGFQFIVEEWAGLLTDAQIEADIDAEKSAYNI